MLHMPFKSYYQPPDYTSNASVAG